MNDRDIYSIDTGERIKPDPSVYFGCLVGESAVMQSLYQSIRQVAKTKANVMLLGESGVGKEMVACAIHRESHCTGDFVATNCGAFSRELIASELFGHEKGAFTGAIQRKSGVFEQADGGTLFLDEITEMPLELQPNLLRVLETNTVQRLGAIRSESVSTRVISASNRTLSDIATQHILREDLYFRLAVFPLVIPPLRERYDDIPLLAHFFIHQFNQQYNDDLTLNPEQLIPLLNYHWPGNVRELRHVLHRAYILSMGKGNEIQLPADIASPFGQLNRVSVDVNVGVGKTVEEVERELIEKTLQHVNGDKQQAAHMLGISLKTLYNRLHSYQNVFRL